MTPYEKTVKRAWAVFYHLPQDQRSKYRVKMFVSVTDYPNDWKRINKIIRAMEAIINPDNTDYGSVRGTGHLKK